MKQSGNEIGWDYPDDDDFWFEEGYPEETAAEALARMTPAERESDRIYCQMLEERLAEEGRKAAEAQER